MLTTATAAAPVLPGGHATYPLDRFHLAPERLLFASGNPEEVQAQVGRVMKPHRLTVTGPSSRLNARMHFSPVGGLSLSRLRYGDEVVIEPGPLESFFLVQMPLRGTAHVSTGAQEVDSTVDVASVVSPDDELHMRWHAGNDQLMLRLPRSLVERCLVGMLGHPLHEPLRFNLGFRWRESQAWLGLLSYLTECVGALPELHKHPLIVGQIEQLAASILLASQHHNYSALPPPRSTTVLPRHVRRAQDYLQAHAHEPITAEQLAELSGVSVRSLYAGFKKFLGVSPMHYLHEIRLERARTEFLSGEAINVTGVALRWGFAHMGRFSLEYKRRFGEMPSQTLKRH